MAAYDLDVAEEGTIIQIYRALCSSSRGGASSTGSSAMHSQQTGGHHATG